MAVTHSVSDQGLLQSWSNNWDNSDKHKLFISFHFSAAANVDNAGEIELSEWCISVISTEVFFISWFVFLAFALISSLRISQSSLTMMLMVVTGGVIDNRDDVIDNNTAIHDNDAVDGDNE